MKKVFLLSTICLITFFSMSCTFVNNGNGFESKKIVGNGILKDEMRTITDFSAIVVSGGTNVLISDYESSNITVSGDENLLEYIETSVENGILNIHFKNGYGYATKIGVKVTVPNNGKINSIIASGSSNIFVESTLTADELRLNCKGSSDFKGNIKAHKCELKFSGSSDFRGNVEAITCDIDCSGSSDCIITGKADVCTASLSGSCDLKGYDFIVEKMNCSSSGSSDIQITCNQELNAKASGSSDVNYKGNAVIISKHTSGSSDINHKD